MGGVSRSGRVERLSFLDEAEFHQQAWILKREIPPLMLQDQVHGFNLCSAWKLYLVADVFAPNLAA